MKNPRSSWLLAEDMNVRGKKMRSYNLNLYFIISLFFCFLSTSQADVRRDIPNSESRAQWCEVKYDQCIDSMREDCWILSDNMKMLSCTSNETKACQDAYGTGSDCLTREHVSNDAPKVKPISNQNVVEVPGVSAGTTGHSNLIAPLVAPVAGSNNVMLMTSQGMPSSIAVKNDEVLVKPGYRIQKVARNKVWIVNKDSGETGATIKCSACSASGHCSVTIKSGSVSCERTCKNGCIIHISTPPPTKVPDAQVVAPSPTPPNIKRPIDGRLSGAATSTGKITAPPALISPSEKIMGTSPKINTEVNRIGAAKSAAPSEITVQPLTARECTFLGGTVTAHNGCPKTGMKCTASNGNKMCITEAIKN